MATDVSQPPPTGNDTLDRWIFRLWKRIKELSTVLAETSGTWTPADASGAGLSLTVSYAKWRRHANLMHIEAAITYPATGSGASSAISGLPVASLNTTAGQVISNGAGAPHSCQIASTTLNILAAGGTAITNANLTGAVVYINATYSV